MVDIDLRDPKFDENMDAINILKNSGMFTDDEIQDLYEKQRKREKEKEK